MARLNAISDNFWNRGQIWYHFWLDSLSVSTCSATETLNISENTNVNSILNESNIDSLFISETINQVLEVKSSQQDSLIIVNITEGIKAITSQSLELLNLTESIESARNLISNLIDNIVVSDLQNSIKETSDFLHDNININDTISSVSILLTLINDNIEFIEQLIFTRITESLATDLLDISDNSEQFGLLLAEEEELLLVIENIISESNILSNLNESLYINDIQNAIKATIIYAYALEYLTNLHDNINVKCIFKTSISDSIRMFDPSMPINIKIWNGIEWEDVITTTIFQEI